MASYYYLISSLPMLRPNEEPPFDYSAFLEMCAAVVSGKTYETLAGLTVNADSGPLLEEWARFYRTLTAELNYQRNVRLGRPGTPPETGDPGVTEAVSAALNAKNPLESEQLLLRLEFSRLDAMIGLHNFDDHALYGYSSNCWNAAGASNMRREKRRFRACWTGSSSRSSASGFESACCLRACGTGAETAHEIACCD